MTIENLYGFTVWAVPRFRRPVSLTHQPAPPRKAGPLDGNPNQPVMRNSVSPALLGSAPLKLARGRLSSRCTDV